MTPRQLHFLQRLVAQKPAERRNEGTAAEMAVHEGVGRRDDRVVVEGVNLIKRHTRPNPQKNVKGGIVEREAALHASNVQLVCPECGKMTRIGHQVQGDRKVRICRKCEGVVDK